MMAEKVIWDQKLGVSDKVGKGD